MKTARFLTSILFIVLASSAGTAHSADNAPTAPALKLPYIAADEFLAGWRTTPSRALAFFLGKLNAANEVRGVVTSLHFEVSHPLMKDAYQLVPRFETDGVHVEIQIHPRFAENPIVLFEVMSALKAFSVYDFTNLLVQKPQASGRTMSHSPFDLIGITGWSTSDVQTPIQWAELELNARAGDKFARLESVKNRAGLADSKKYAIHDFLEISHFSDPVQLKTALADLATLRSIPFDSQLSLEESVALYLESERARDLETISALEKQAQAEWVRIRKKTDALSETKTQEEAALTKFDDYVKANDRANVARLLELYLPWSEMTPIETGAWKNWVEAIRHPNPADTVLLFRGIGEKEPVFEIKNEDGQKTKRAMLSTVMTKNQGNYTRRLRSLQTLRYRLGFRKNPKSTEVRSPLQNSPKMTSIMINHSRDPKGSPFLSFSTKAEVGYGFGDREVLAVRMDRRRVLPNIGSSLKHELEMLVPLVVFPDEIIHYTNEPISHAAIQKFKDDTLKKAPGGVILVSTQEEVTRSTFENGYRLLHDAVRTGVKAPACRAAF